jgi:hypothetical protein
MKGRIFRFGMIGLALILGLALAGCWNGEYKGTVSDGFDSYSVVLTLKKGKAYDIKVTNKADATDTESSSGDWEKYEATGGHAARTKSGTDSKGSWAGVRDDSDSKKFKTFIIYGYASVGASWPAAGSASKSVEDGGVELEVIFEDDDAEDDWNEAAGE